MVAEKMSVAQVACRFFLKKQEGKHTITLFTGSSLKAGISVLLCAVFDVPIEADDGLSPYACRNCIGSARTLHEKLLKLRAMAESSYKNAQKV